MKTAHAHTGPSPHPCTGPHRRRHDEVGKIHLPGTFRIGRCSDTRHRDTIRQSSGYFFGQHRMGGGAGPAFLQVEVAAAKPITSVSNTSMAPEKQIRVINSPKGD